MHLIVSHVLVTVKWILVQVWSDESVHSIFHSHPHRTSDFPLSGMWLPQSVFLCLLSKWSQSSLYLLVAFYAQEQSEEMFYPSVWQIEPAENELLPFYPNLFLDFTLTVLASRIHSALSSSVFTAPSGYGFLGLVPRSGLQEQLRKVWPQNRAVWVQFSELQPELPSACLSRAYRPHLAAWLYSWVGCCNASFTLLQRKRF